MKLRMLLVFLLILTSGGWVFGQTYISTGYSTGPFATAIDTGKNVAVVVNRYTNTLMTIDLDDNSLLNYSSPLLLDHYTDQYNAFAKGPIAVAVDSTRHQAVVANYESSSITLVSLADTSAPTVVKTISLIDPNNLDQVLNCRAVAIDVSDNIAIVVNATASSISLVDLTNLVVMTPTPLVIPNSTSSSATPIAIAYSESRKLGFVANYGSSTLTLIDMSSPTSMGTDKLTELTSTSSGLWNPTSIALDDAQGVAIVTNSGSTTVSLVVYVNYPASGSISFESSLSVGVTPVSVDVNTSTHLAAIVSYSSKSITFVDLSNGAAPVKMNNPAIYAGSTPYQITVNSANNTALVANPASDYVLEVSLGFINYIPFVIDTAQFRSNLGINCLGSGTATVTVELDDAEGNIISPISDTGVNPKTYSVSSYGMYQVSKVIQDILGMAEVTDVQGSLKIISDQPLSSWVSIIDNTTNDPNIEIGHATGSSHLLANSVTNTGAFLSQVIIYNAGSSAASVTLTARDTTGTVIATNETAIAIPAHGFFVTDDVLGETLDLDAGYYGPLEIYDSSSQPLIATSRVYAGNYSGFMEAQEVP